MLRNTRFDRIRYAQCWEDADVMLDAIGVSPEGTYLSIASAGDNALALVGAGAQRVIAVDLNPAQIACLELRVAGYRRLDHSGLLELLGERDSTHRLQLYQRCRSDLSSESRDYWDGHSKLIAAGIARAGRFERFLSAFRRYLLPLAHSRRTVDRLFQLETVAERRAWYDAHWDTPTWRLLARFCFGRESLGRFGRARSFTQYADEPVWKSLERRIPDALVIQRPADNPYLQWILKGRFDTAQPYALRPENFESIRANLSALEWHCASLEPFLAQLPDDGIDGFNLSDVFEYLAESDCVPIFQQLARVATAKARLVYWNVVTDRERPPSLAQSISRCCDVADELHRRDKAFFYRRLIVEEVM